MKEQNEKQAIEEMHKDVYEAICHNSIIDIIHGGFLVIGTVGLTKELYDDGYRKQNEMRFGMRSKKIIEKNIMKLINANEIWVTMYGMHKSKDCAIKIKTERISSFYIDYNGNFSFTYVWGFPGPDLNTYYVKDYGETWALTEEELLIEKGGVE